MDPVSPEGAEQQPQMSILEKANFIKKALAEVRDPQRPVTIRFNNSDDFPWKDIGIEDFIPRKAVIQAVHEEKQEKGHKKYYLFVNFMPFLKMRTKTPFFSFYLSDAVEINKKTGEVFIDCKRSKEEGIAMPMEGII